MNRKNLFGFLVFLLVLPPMAMHAQRLTGYEYWFDGKVSSRVSRSLSGYEAEINTDVETQHLSSGLHTLHIRFNQSGGEYDYSPVTSQLFFKHNAEEGGKIEYWFDNDITNSATVPLPSNATEDTVNVALKMTDAIKFPLGFHQLNMRVATEGKSLSSIYTSHVLKVPSGEIDVIEYWVDDDYDHPKTVEGHVASYDENMYIFVNPFDLSGVPSGPHRIYYRPASKNGKACGAVSMASVIVGGGTPSKIEYWFDGDIAKSATVDLPSSALTDTVDVALVMNNSEKFPLGLHQLSMRLISKDREQSPIYSARVLKKASGKIDVIEYWIDDWVDKDGIAHPKTITGNTASSEENAFVFNNTFDLSEVSEGYHRVYYRATSNKGNANSAVSMTPVMVKSRYNVEDREALTVTEQAYWFDDEEQEIRIVSDPKNIRDLPLTLDARKLKDGKHTLHLQYGNSAGIWNSPADFTFTKNKVDDPIIVANASLEDGVVTLKFSTVPYGQSYDVVRQYPSGTVRRVEPPIKNAEFPADLKSIDKPAPGNYIYYVEGRYLDADGVVQKVRSGEMNVTVEQSASDVKRGSINGIIKLDGRAYDNRGYHVTINGKNAISHEDYKFGYNSNGTFYISNIPYNTEITIGIKRDYYKFEDVILTVNENTADTPIQFNGTWTGEKEEIMPESDDYDLELAEKIHITPNGWEIPIHNLSSKTWSGNLIVKVISKKVQDEIGKGYSNEAGSALDVLYFKTDVYYTTVADMPVNIQGCRDGSQVVVLDIKDLPNADKNEDYYVYVLSKKEGEEVTKMLQESYYKNPQVLKFNPYDYASAIINGSKSVLDESVEVMKVLKQIADWEDPFKLAWEKCPKDAWNQFIKTYDKNKDDKDLIEDQFNTIMRSAGLLLNCFYGELNGKLYLIRGLKKYSGYDAAEKITDLYKSLKDVKEAEKGHKFFELAKMVLNYADKGDPVVSIYKTYFEVGHKMIDAIENMTYGIHDHDVWYKLHEGQGVYKIKIRKYTDSKDGTRYFSGRDFCGRDLVPSLNDITHDGQIKSISIRLYDPQNKDGLTKEVEEENIDLVDDGIVIKNLKFPHYEGLAYEDVEAWMTIVWKNDRVTHVPLLDKDFVKLENFNRDTSNKPLTMTVEFQSGCYLHEEGIPQNLTFIKPETWLDF